MTYEGKPPAGADVPRPDRPWFYGTLIDALRDLPHKMLNTVEIGSVADVADAIGRVEQQIESLYTTKFAPLIGRHD